jgi:dihydrofolate synthase/folylpolyglutamate synthase
MGEREGKDEGVSAPSYERVLRWLYTLEAAKGMDFKLERVGLALRRLDDPHERFAAVHVAGTNGKGSTAAMIEAILSRAGHRVGLYTSPHLVSFRERIRIGGEEISEDEVVDLTGEIQRAGAIDLTFFEFVTVMAFLHFARRGVDAAVVEVGLGGRLDATNVIDPRVSVVTTVGIDHTEYLGRSLRSIASEKGGIIKPRRPVVLGRVRPTAARVLRRLACEAGAPVSEAGVHYSMSDGEEPTFRGLGWTLESLRLGLRGAHQRENAATALAALALVRDELPVSEASIREGLARVHWPGRFEIVAEEPTTILDGAHNADGARVLRREVEALLDGRALHVLFAVMKDKDWRPMVRQIAPLCASVTVSQVLPPRGHDPEPVADYFRRWCEARVERNPAAAWQAIRRGAGSRDAILATGSLFLVGAVRPLCALRSPLEGPSTAAQP